MKGFKVVNWIELATGVRKGITRWEKYEKYLKKFSFE